MEFLNELPITFRTRFLIRSILVLSALVLIAATVIVFGAGLTVFALQIKHYDRLFGVFCLVLLPAGWWLLNQFVVAVHESGHALAAHAFGWRNLYIRVGRLLLVRQGIHWSIRRSKMHSWYGGEVFCFPTNQRNYHTRKFLIFAAGPAANLGLALICISVLMALPMPSIDWHRDSFVEMVSKLIIRDGNRFTLTSVLGATAVLNLLHFTWSLVPMRRGGNDCEVLSAYLVLRILRVPLDEPSLPRPGLGGFRFTGLRPRDWDASAIEELLKQGDPESEALASLYGYYRALDLGQLEIAGDLIDRALLTAHEVKGFDRSAIYLEAAYFEGCHRVNPKLARAWLHKTAPDELLECTFLRGAAAVLIAEGLNADARSSALYAFDQSDASGDVFSAEAEREWLYPIIDHCNNRLKAEYETATAKRR